MAAKTPGFKWTFQRLGGLDQVALDDADAIRRLRELDPKLWVALSCPASGLQFDPRTLVLVDTDKDGRIRIPEVVEAAEWTAARLKDAAGIREQADFLPLDAIRDDTEDGHRLILTGKAILEGLDKADAGGLTQEDVSQAAAGASRQVFNGDGILPPLVDFEPVVRDFIRDALAVVGGVRDAGGEIGINQPIADAFMKTLAEWSQWQQSLEDATGPLGDAVHEAWDLLAELRDKVDDYFLRCDLVAFAPGALDKLGVDEERLAAAGQAHVEPELLAELPLSRVGADRPLDLRSGINPAWRDRLIRFGELIKPLLADPGIITREEWQAIEGRFEPYAKALANKPGTETLAVAVPPTQKVDKLGEGRIRELLAGDAHERFSQLAAQDADIPAAAADIGRVERLVLYHRHLHRLLINFVNFEEFYSLRRTAAFQSGRLYIDSRCCRLCMPADNVDKHAELAANSQLYLLYCECVRDAGAGDGGDPEKATVVAAVTAGDSDLLMPGRNGVYVDNRGDDWDATVVKIVPNPIGLWEAMWSPYKRVGNLIAEQVRKFAGDKQDALMSAAGKKVGDLAAAPAAPAAGAAKPAPFDIGKSVGIFAAVGLALGAIGTAVGSIANAVFGMTWWQFPLLIAGLFAIVSGPSLVLAWLKLRKRTLGPLLEASGWAVNGRVTVNYTLAKRLTDTAALPPGATLTTRDPLAKTRSWRIRAFLIAVLVGVLATAAWLRWRPAATSAPTPAPAAAIESGSVTP